MGHLVEKVCGIEWWNYSWIPLHITKYTSIPTSMGFSLFITMFMKYCFTPLYKYFAKMDFGFWQIFSCVIMVLMTIDFIYSGIYMLKNHQTLLLWRFSVTEVQVLKFVMIFVVGSAIVLIKNMFFDTYRAGKCSEAIDGWKKK